MRKKILLAAILSTSLVSIAQASADGATPGLPAGMFKSLDNYQAPTPNVEVQPPAVEKQAPDVKESVQGMREKIKGYLERELKDKKNKAKEQVQHVKDVKSGKAPKLITKESLEKKPVSTAKADTGEVEVVEPTVTKSFKVPENSIKAKVNGNGVYQIDGLSGQTHVVEISKGLFNKIRTPFAYPKILTTAKLDVKKKGSDLYIATGSSKLIGLWVYDSENPSNTVSLALVPRPVSPVSMSVNYPDEHLYGDNRTALPASTEVRATDMPAHKNIGPSSEFEKEVVDLIQLMVEGNEYPEGYGVTRYNNPVAGSVCGHPDIKGKLRESLNGEMFNIDVISIKNFSAYPARIEESRCYSDGVVAVSQNPVDYLASGQVGELLIVKINQDYVQKMTPKKDLRPSIDNGEW